MVLLLVVDMCCLENRSGKRRMFDGRQWFDFLTTSSCHLLSRPPPTEQTCKCQCPFELWPGFSKTLTSSPSSPACNSRPFPIPYTHLPSIPFTLSLLHQPWAHVKQLLLGVCRSNNGHQPLARRPDPDRPDGPHELVAAHAHVLRLARCGPRLVLPPPSLLKDGALPGPLSPLRHNY